MRHCSFTGREINLELFNIFQIFDNLSLVDSIDVNIVSKAIRKEQWSGNETDERFTYLSIQYALAVYASCYSLYIYTWAFGP